MTKKTSSCLIDEPPIAFLPTLAKIAGVDGALVLQQIHFWLIQPKIGRAVDDAKWVRNSLEEWQRDNFPFWSKSKISRVITKLEDLKLIVSRDDLNRHGYDRTKWYSIDYGNLQNCKMQVAKLQDAACRNDTTIPETTSKITIETTDFVANATPPPPPGDSEQSQNGTSKDIGVDTAVSEMLEAWGRLFPNKPQPRPATYRSKIKSQLALPQFRECWLEAMEWASKSPSCQSESWFHFGFFVQQSKGEYGWEKCLRRWMDWKDKKIKANGNGRTDDIEREWQSIKLAAAQPGRPDISERALRAIQLHVPGGWHTFKQQNVNFFDQLKPIFKEAYERVATNQPATT